jgi:CheY-like chemotaxis protein
MSLSSAPAATSVLVVEDDFLVRHCAVEALSESGFKVLEAGNGPDAMAILESAQVDVVFTDVNMPGAFDGLGLARRINHRWPRIAVVITSGRGYPDGDPACARFLPKPYMLDTLADLIEDEARRHRRSGAASGLGRLAG